MKNESTQEKLATKLRTVESMFTIQSSLNGIFTTEVINGDSTARVTDAILDDDVKPESIATVEKALAELRLDNEWMIRTKALTEEAQKQSSANETILDVLAKQKDLVGLSERRSNYEEAKELLKEIKNKDLHKKYEAQLAKIETILAMDEKKEQIRVEAEEKLREQEAALAEQKST